MKEDRTEMKLLKYNLETIINEANLIFLFLFSLHLFNFPDKYIMIWCAFTIVIFWIQNRSICLDKVFWALSLAVILNAIGTYRYLTDLNYTLKDIVKMVVPTIMVYPFMKQTAWNKREDYIEKIILAIALGTFAYSMLNYTSFLKTGLFSIEARNWNDFWSGYAWRATHYSYWGCFIVGMSGYGIYCLSRKEWLKGFAMIIFVIIENYIQIEVINRMVLCVTVVALLVSFCLYSYLNIKNKEKIRKGIVIVLGVVAVVGFMFVFDVFGISSSGYFQRFVTRDGGILGNVRFQMIYEAIKMLPSHWKGGARMYAAGNFWVHNYWLQVANVSGIFPFVLWMIVNVAAVWDVIKVVTSPYISNRIKYMLLPMLASIVAYLMMEPGGTESNRYIIFYVILIALLKQLANNKHTGVADV